MTGPEHYREAEALAESALEWMGGWGESEMPAAERLARKNSDLAKAQVHATLALAAATALANYCGNRMTEGDSRRWFEIASAHPEYLERQRELDRAELAAFAEEEPS